MPCLFRRRIGFLSQVISRREQRRPSTLCPRMTSSSPPLQTSPLLSGAAAGTARGRRTATTMPVTDLSATSYSASARMIELIHGESLAEAGFRREPRHDDQFLDQAEAPSEPAPGAGRGFMRRRSVAPSLRPAAVPRATVGQGGDHDGCRICRFRRRCGQARTPLQLSPAGCARRERLRLLHDCWSRRNTTAWTSRCGVFVVEHRSACIAGGRQLGARRTRSFCARANSSARGTACSPCNLRWRQFVEQLGCQIAMRSTCRR